MDQPATTVLGQPCPSCGSLVAPTANSPRCPFCGARLIERPDRFLRRLVWLGRAYRVWSLGVFAVAVCSLMAIGDSRSFVLTCFVLFPFGAALSIAYKWRDNMSPWIIAFLVLVDVGVVLAPEHRVLPFLNMFPEIPRTQDRILTWYFLIYFLLQFVVVPPVFFARSLRTARRGGTPALNPWICLAGFGVWTLLVVLTALVVYSKWLK